MWSALKRGLSNMAAFWSAMPTLKFAWAGAASATQNTSVARGSSRLCMVIATDDTREGCGIPGTSAQAGPKLRSRRGDRNSPEGQACRAAARAPGRARREPLPGRPGALHLRRQGQVDPQAGGLALQLPQHAEQLH